MAKGASKNRSKAETADTIESALKALIEATNQRATWDALVSLSQDTDFKENDRSAAILISTIVETALQDAITHKLRLTTSGQRELFDSKRGLLSDFAAKILIGQRIGVFGKENTKQPRRNTINKKFFRSRENTDNI